MISMTEKEMTAYTAGAKWKECFAYSMLQRREGSWIEVKGVR